MKAERQELLDLSVDIGRGLLESGAETYRVEESIGRILKAYGFEKAEVFAIPTCIITSVSDADGTLTKVERIFHRHTNLDRVTRLNNLSRWICDNLPDNAGIREKIRQAMDVRAYPLLIRMLGFAIVGAAFTLFLGGTRYDALAAALAALATKPVIELLDRFQTNVFFTNIIGGGIISAIALASEQIGLSAQTDLVIIGALMNLVPGVAITNSMRDIIAGDLVSGLTKLVEALIIGLAIALGTGLTFILVRYLF